MIVYPFTCDRGHVFEGWFASADTYERQAVASQIQCPACSSAQVRKLPAAPHVKSSAGGQGVMTIDRDTRRRALATLRKAILDNTESVGSRFAEIARRIHYGEEAPRGIRGRVTFDEAAELSEEGIAAYPVPPEVISGEEVH